MVRARFSCYVEVMEPILMEKKEPRTEEFTVRLPKTVKVELEKAQREAGISKNEMVVRLLQAALAAVKVR